MRPRPKAIEQRKRAAENFSDGMAWIERGVGRLVDKLDATKLAR